MSVSYAAENHDWDLTLSAAESLLSLGNAAIAKQQSTVAMSKKVPFSCWTGSMLLAFSAIESFSASVAFSMPRSTRFSGFDFEAYRKKGRFWDKLDLIYSAIPHAIDRSQGLFHTIDEMRKWRNLVTHASPYVIEETPVSDTHEAPRKLHKQVHKAKEYAGNVNSAKAVKFCDTAYEYIDFTKKLTGLDPRASATYKIDNPDTPDVSNP